jgi:nucleotide-binding universal stress UspA family protein
MNMIDYPKYKKVLFCTDFSKISDCAFDYAFGIAKRDEAVLYILHVIPPAPPLYGYSSFISKEQLDKVEADNQKYKAKVKIVTESGREDEKILEFVQKEKIDILVIGTKGRTGMEHVFLGSVAEKVIRRSPIPVFVIPCKDKTGPT